MKNITVFLASSDELKNDRNSFHSLVASLDEIFEPRGYRIRCRRWEDFSAFCTGTRTQDDYNRIVRASDICICMFHRKAGEYTIEEFNQALDEYVKNQSHPKTFVYIRALIEGEMEDEALKRFKEDLFDRVGHYWCNYATDDAMKLHFVMQLERIIPSVSGNASVTEGNHFKIENGVVSLYGHKIAELDNLSFAAENPEYLSLKESIARLNTEIARLRATGVAELQPMIDEKQAELYKKRESLNRLESQLFDLALSINKLIGSGTPVSERKRLAIEMFERDVEINVEDPELYNARIVKLTLQPLVENSIFSGIEPSGKQGLIQIHIYAEDQVLYISIRDNGIGISEENIRRLLTDTGRVTKHYMSGIGLPNVDRRIKLVYGEEYGLKMESEVGRYTCVTVSLPLEFSDEMQEI